MFTHLAIVLMCADSALTVQRITSNAGQDANKEDIAHAVAAAYKHRAARAALHVSFTVRTEGRNHKYLDGKLAEVVYTLSPTVINFKQIGNSYSFLSKRYDSSTDSLLALVHEHYDARAGVMRGYTTVDGSTHAAIKPKPDPYVDSTRYMYWVNARHSNQAESVFLGIMNGRANWKVTESERGRVTLELPWVPRWSRVAVGTKRYTLDADKGYMPVTFKGRWEVAGSNGKPEWRREEFTVLESKQVDNVWMPIKLREIIGSSNAEEGVVTVYDMYVTDISFRFIDPSELSVRFPTGTKVVDAIKGIVYTQGDGGIALNQDRLLAAPIKGPDMPPPNRPPFLVYIGIALFCLLIGYVVKVYYLRRRARGIVS